MPVGMSTKRHEDNAGMREPIEGWKCRSGGWRKPKLQGQPALAVTNRAYISPMTIGTNYTEVNNGNNQ